VLRLVKPFSLAAITTKDQQILKSMSKEELGVVKLSNKNSLGSFSSYRSNTRYQRNTSSEEDDDDGFEGDEYEDEPPVAQNPNTQSAKVLHR
jgi:hypothetical protein